MILSFLAPTGLHGLDLLGLVCLLVFLVVGFRGGFWWQLVRLLGLVTSVAVARGFAPRLSAALASIFTHLEPRIASGLAWAVILGAGITIVALVGRIGSRVDAPREALGLVDRLGGASAGVLTGLVLHAAILLCIGHFAATGGLDAACPYARGSHSRHFLATLGHGIPGLVEGQAAHAFGLDRADGQAP